ncbi:MAG TPA: hypothetical protein VGM34_01835 [Chlamydiales bacterium]
MEKQTLRLQLSSPEEIERLLQVVDRDLKDTKASGLSSDRKFAIAYSAALLLTTVVLRAKGYRTNPSMGGHHAVCIHALPFIMGSEWRPFSRYLDLCRGKRHTCEYASVDETTDEDAATLIREAEKFHREVIKWLKTHHPSLLVSEKQMARYTNYEK